MESMNEVAVGYPRSISRPEGDTSAFSERANTHECSNKNNLWRRKDRTEANDRKDILLLYN